MMPIHNRQAQDDQGTPESHFLGQHDTVPSREDVDDLAAAWPSLTDCAGLEGGIDLFDMWPIAGDSSNGNSR